MSAWSEELRRGLERWLAHVATEAQRTGASPLEQDRTVRAARAHYEEWRPQPWGRDSMEVGRFLGNVVRQWRARGWTRP